jgi:hypothetical protein
LKQKQRKKRNPKKQKQNENNRCNKSTARKPASCIWRSTAWFDFNYIGIINLVGWLS